MEARATESKRRGQTGSHLRKGLAMLRTRITEQYELNVPFICAGMGFVGMPPLVAAVSNAGGMGTLGASPMPPEAVRAMIRFGFEMMNLNRVEARCIAENIASARVMEKAGMTFEGILREHMFVKGKYQDLKMYSILRKEWSE